MAASPDRLREIQSGAKPRVLDLFAGCGGLSLGMQAAGFEIVACVESDKDAAATHARNLFRHLPADERQLHAEPRDITTTTPGELCEALGLGPPEGAVDVIVGGPPCQAFARIGRAKLRDLRDHPEAYLQDPRSDLYLRYLDYVRAFRPLAVLVENVPEFLNYGGHNLAEEMCEVLEKEGYTCRYSLLNAVRYGVPQFRERVFLIAFASTLGIAPTFPIPSHRADVPSGYKGTRSHALKETPTQADLFGIEPRYVDPPSSASAKKPAITARDAIGDLPGDPERGKSASASSASQVVLQYEVAVRSEYAKQMVEWPRLRAEGLTHHVTRDLPRDFPIFYEMAPGEEYPAALAIAHKLIDSGQAEPGAPDLSGLLQKGVPPYPAHKFKSKWWKMRPDRPSKTVTAHLSKDTYSHIHYSKEEARTITVREAARLQSFPDGFIFEGGLNSAFRQVGNAVPPLMARALGTSMLVAMRDAKRASS